MTEATPTRAVALDLMDERRAMREGYVFLDEKCLLLAGAILQELARYGERARALAAAHAAADWPPPARCAVKVYIGDTGEAGAYLVFDGTAYLNTIARDGVTYSLYGNSITTDAAANTSTTTGTKRMYRTTSFISAAWIFLPRYSGVRPTIRPAMKTESSAKSSIP